LVRHALAQPSGAPLAVPDTVTPATLQAECAAARLSDRGASSRSAGPTGRYHSGTLACESYRAPGVMVARSIRRQVALDECSVVCIGSVDSAALRRSRSIRQPGCEPV
jgi:hypothetical protein